jgi:hypothetical protein
MSIDDMWHEASAGSSRIKPSTALALTKDATTSRKSNCQSRTLCRPSITSHFDAPRLELSGIEQSPLAATGFQSTY